MPTDRTNPAASRPCVFFDRDGIVNRSPGAGYVERVEDFHILPEFIAALREVEQRGYAAVIVSNQKCVSTGIVSRETVEAIHARLLRELEMEGLHLLAIYYCPHGGDHPERKPAPGMLLRAAREHNLDLDRSWMIGDSERDAEAGRAAGCATVLVKAGDEPSCAEYRLESMGELAAFLRRNLAAIEAQGEQTPPSQVRHRWKVSPKRGIEIQRELAARVIREDQYEKLELVAGIDVGFTDRNRSTVAAVAVLSYPELQLREYVVGRAPTRMPYISGLLSFREIPAVLIALEKLRTMPDMLLCDGQGIAHPRRLGLASHLGLATGLPSIGVAKSRLCGEYEEPGPKRGDYSPLMDRGEQIGVVLRTRSGIKPVFVSIGHKVALDSAREIVMNCTSRYRLPQTTRWAHRIASGLRPSIGLKKI
jgi:deoxyribonuclease V